MLTLEDLGVLRDVDVEDDTVVVTLTPTYSGCPALATMRADVLVALHRAGYERRRGPHDALARVVVGLDQFARPGRARRARHLTATPERRGRPTWS